MSEQNLPPAERDVLAALHRLGPATSRQILESLSAFRPMALGSVVTLLRRLETKGLVSKTKGPVGKAFLYQARLQPRVTFGGLVRQLVQRVFHGDSVALMASLFETKPPTLEEVDGMQQMLEELRAKKKGKREE